jgi:hypothetical protein
MCFKKVFHELDVIIEVGPRVEFELFRMREEECVKVEHVIK